MEFLFRSAKKEDLCQIMEIMNEAKENQRDSGWFVADDQAYVEEHINNKGFVVTAESCDNELAGFFLIKYPEKEENLGNYLGYEKEKLDKVVIMDSAAVKEKYQGNGLQYRMLQYAEKQLEKKKYRIFMCTVHPENQYSLNNMQKNGYVIKKRVQCYGGLERYILEKRL